MGLSFGMRFHLTRETYVNFFYTYLPFRSHYENMPIQIYWKFYNQKEENFQIKILIFFIFLLKT